MEFNGRKIQVGDKITPNQFVVTGHRLNGEGVSATVEGGEWSVVFDRSNMHLIAEVLPRPFAVGDQIRFKSTGMRGKIVFISVKNGNICVEFNDGDGSIGVYRSNLVELV